MGGEKDDHHHHHRHHSPHHHHHHHDEEQPPPPMPPPPPAHYGTFQGVSNYPPQPVTGFPQPVPPPGLSDSPYGHGYQGVPVIEIPGYPVADGRPVGRERRLPCCGIGVGWFFFILGFFLGGIPWYIGAFIILCARVDHREKPGYIACTIAAILAIIAIVFGVTSRDWD